MSNIKKIAKLAGVSVATVSRALTNPEKLSPKTLEKVKQALKKIGFEPQYNIRKHKSTLSRTITVILSDIKENYPTEVIKGIVDCANEHNYQVMFAHIPINQKPLSFEQLLIYKYCEGLILLCDKLPTGLKQSKVEHLPPMVMAYEYNSQLNIPSVHVDNLSAAFKVVSYLIKMGHRNIAEIGSIQKNTLFQFRHQGYELALKRNSLKINDKYTICETASFEGGAKALNNLLTLENPPTAIFCHHDVMAIGALQEAKRLNINVPKDLSIIGCDNIPFAEYCEPALTTISLPNYDIGAHALKLLLNLIKGEEQETHSHLLETDLIIRDSVAVPKITYRISQFK